MGKNRTKVMRVDPLMKQFLEEMQMKKLVKEKRITPMSRITLAMFNQYNKYPKLKKELENSDLRKKN